ncbi:DUF6671 family protein [Chitinibacter tainanensis]|uniref:DUF6671 family protein n=1 Tax=Chitinibacter tainanensis TaxID=230667 RepID=UPI0023524D83|nr:DUF6671 family protein [Chitinibacter tainanensis]
MSAHPPRYPRAAALRGERVLVASRHHKAAAMQRPFAALLGVELWSPPELDTDRFGTFSGEIERPGPPVAMLQAKIALAQADYPAQRYWLASEGSYGPHPYWPQLAVGEEWLMWLDAQTGQSLTERRRFTTRHYGAWMISNWAELRARLAQCPLPALALTLRPLAGDLPAQKALRDVAAVEVAYAEYVAAGSPAVVLALDMRAHLHPPRQRSLRRLATRLAHRLATACPACGAAGFGERQLQPGLPCADCGLATAQPAALVYACSQCGHRELHRHYHTPADPRWCDYCNP